jgi:hypothetical protein
MRALKLSKVAVFSLLLFFITQASAKQFILDGDNYIIDERVQNKIAQIGLEVKTKLNTNIYVYIKNSYGIKKEDPIREKIKIIKSHESNLIKNLQKPYALLTLSLEDMHVNLITSKNLKDVLNKDEILNDYVIPLLASKDKNQLSSKVSAAIINGYAQIAQEIANSKNVKLESNIGNQGKVTGTVWRVFMYTLIVGGLLLYIYAIMRRKK